jgi:translation initiation factor 2-alpha kinase 4
MAPTNPWGKKNTSASGFPRLKPAQSKNEPLTGTQNTYQEIQENELIALSSIYGDDFQRIETKQGAWKVRAPDLVTAYLLDSFSDSSDSQMSPAFKYNHH